MGPNPVGLRAHRPYPVARTVLYDLPIFSLHPRYPASLEQAKAITCLREPYLLPYSPHRFHSRESQHDGVIAHGLLAA